MLSIESSDLVYKQLDCEDDLFTARVYKRNHRPLIIQRIMKQEDHGARSAKGKLVAPVAPDNQTSSVQPPPGSLRSISGGMLLEHKLLLVQESHTKLLSYIYQESNCSPVT